MPADLEDAELDLARTTITAPFNAWVRETFVEVGTVISVGDGIARIYGLDKAMAGELLAR